MSTDASPDASPQTISVEPAADFGDGHGMLVFSGSGSRPDRVVIRRADRVVYIPDEWMDQAAAGAFPWAEVVITYPWSTGRSIGDVLKIRGTDRTVIYRVIGGCGPRVRASLCEQPD